MPNRFMLSAAAACLLTAMSASASSRASGDPGRRSLPPRMPLIEVIVDGVARPQLAAHGVRYVEALKNRDYAIRITNPYPVRVAVALAVDGLNSIDARHTSAADARKWVIGPFETITIEGWQVSQHEARRFRFTTEERSYGRTLGQTANLGVITAVFFRERAEDVANIMAQALPAPAAPAAAAKSRSAADTSAAGAAREEYAATGMGHRTGHRVRSVAVELEDTPAVSATIRYEFREQLVKLGVIADDALGRRERARGFEPGFCPEPKR